jgi:hypothetical protein
MVIGTQEFEITQPGRRVIRVEPDQDRTRYYVSVRRFAGVGAIAVYRYLGTVAWEPSIGTDGCWCAYVDPAAFMPNGDEPARVVRASVPLELYCGDPEAGRPRLIAAGPDHMEMAQAVASWCIRQQAPALGFIPHPWPIRGAGIRGAMANLAARFRGAR